MTPRLAVRLYIVTTVLALVLLFAFFSGQRTIPSIP